MQARSLAAMSAQPVHPHQPGARRVPRTIGGIADALRGPRRAQFFAEVLQAEQGEELDGVLAFWWGGAMLDTNPDRDRVRTPGALSAEDLADFEDAAALADSRARQAAGTASYIPADEVWRRLGLAR
jgi:hypothetical protein